MVGLGDGIGAPGALDFAVIFDVVMRDQPPEVAKAVHPSTAGPGGSDHSAFIDKGIEALALMTDGGTRHPTRPAGPRCGPTSEARR
jgi:Zn-dependent M28 family amino/carboxypeptidase